MDLPTTFKDIAPYLQHPLVLTGFVILLFFGILTALFKAGILPSLPKKMAAEIVKRVINYGFIIALLIIVLGFWQHFRDQSGGKDSGDKRLPADSSLKVKHDSTARSPNAGPDTKQPKLKLYFKVTLLLPSDLNDAEILVDGKLADVIERKLTAVVIRMEKRDVSQGIVVQNSFRVCSTRVLVDGDKQLQPCL